MSLKSVVFAVALAAELVGALSQSKAGPADVVDAPPYSAAETKQAIAVMNNYKCPACSRAYKLLEAYGAAAVPQLLDAVKSSTSTRKVEVELLARAGVPGTGMQLISIANALPDTRADLDAMYVAAIEIDRVRASDAIIARLATTPTAARAAVLRTGLAANPTVAYAWAAKQLRAQLADAVANAELAVKTATSTREKADLVTLMTHVRDPRAKIRLAAGAIEAGHTDVGYALFVSALRAKDYDVRSDALDRLPTHNVSAVFLPRLRSAVMTHIQLSKTRSYGKRASEVLIRLGSDDPVAFDTMFGLLTSGNHEESFSAAIRANLLVGFIAPTLRPRLRALVEQALGTIGTGSRNAQRKVILDRTLAKLI